MDASPGADPDRTILRVLLVVFARRCPAGARFGTRELLTVTPWPSNLHPNCWRRIGIEAAIAPQPHEHGDALSIEFGQLASNCDEIGRRACF